MTSATKEKSETLLERWVGGPRGFVRLLERRGPIFVKIGQFLALRPDLIPPEYCDELIRLFEHVEPFPWSEARKIMREDLKAEPSELFAYIDPAPIAAGSLAQTYYARLPGGAEVAVKVLRPAIDQQIERDLKRARLLARMLELSGAKLMVSPNDVVTEVAAWLREEIDLRSELSNIVRLRSVAKGSRTEVIPKPYPELSSARVLTESFLKGIPVSELLLDRDSRGESSPPVPSVRQGVDCEALARRLLRACLTQIFRYQFFHADLHPGNLIAVRGGRIGFVDFGLCDDIDDTLRKRQMRFLAGLYHGDHEEVFRCLTDILIQTDDSDLAGFRRDFDAATRVWTSSKDSPHSEKSEAYSTPVATYMVAVLRAARTNGLTAPTRILSMYRALLTAESVAHQLGGRTDLLAVGREFFEELEVDEAKQTLRAENIVQALFNYLSLWREYPGQLRQIFADLADGRFVLKVDETEAAELSRLQNRRTRTVVTSILSVALAILISFPNWNALRMPWLVWLLAAGLLWTFLLTALNYRRLR